MRPARALVSAALAVAALPGCAPELSGVKERPARPQAEEQEIVPVGGYEPMAGAWRTSRSDEVIGSQELRMVFEVQKDVFEVSSLDHVVRVRCQASHRTCAGRWIDNMGSGRMTWTFSTDFRSFSGTYDGTSEGRDVGRSSWTGTRE